MFNSCGINLEGKLDCWGCQGADYGQCGVPGEAKQNVESVTTGWKHTCAINGESQRRLKCWGDNTNGQRDVPEN